jgi:N-acetylmuramoyl-L-alanine amidase
MRSSARAGAAVVVLTALVSVLHAQSSQPKTLYTDALLREQTLRRELETARTEAAQSAALVRLRALVGAYEDMSKLFPASGYSDNALWQGAVLAADAFWQFGDAADRSLALRLFAGLTTRFPHSSLVNQVPPHIKRLAEAKPSAVQSRVRTSDTPLPPPPPGVTPAALTSITREVQPEVLRIVLEIAREVPFYDERIEGPSRVFIDLQNTRAVETLKDAVIPFPDDVVKQVRIGRQPNSRTRVVLDLQGANTRYSVYTLYDPYRVVVDFERKRSSIPTTVAAAAPTREADLAPASDSGLAPTSEARIAPTNVSAIAPAREDKIAPTIEASIAPTREERIAPLPAPSPPSTNANGGFSLSRQLGLGVARIVIDPGHGGHDPGAKARGLTEAELVLDVALRLEKLLLKEAGVEVVMTRRTNAFIALEERTAIANRVGADLFLSIHSNASTNDTARGVETYFLNFASNPQAEAVAARENAGGSRTMRNLPDIVRAIALNNKLDESRDFAAMVQLSLFTRLQKTNRTVRNLGVKQAPFMVLVGATMPSILAEISFITNRQEATLLKTDKYKDQIAEALLAGILKYQQALKKVPAIASQRLN